MKKIFVLPKIEIVTLNVKASVCEASCLERCLEIGVCEPYCYLDCLSYGTCTEDTCSTACSENQAYECPEYIENPEEPVVEEEQDTQSETTDPEKIE